MTNWSGNENLRSVIRMSLLGLTFSIAALAQPGAIITFDAPGAGTGFDQGTTATGINAAGVITGYYVDPRNIYHGFLRSTNGVFSIEFKTINAVFHGELSSDGSEITGHWEQNGANRPLVFRRLPQSTR